MDWVSSKVSQSTPFSPNITLPILSEQWHYLAILMFLYKVKLTNMDYNSCSVLLDVCCLIVDQSCWLESLFGLILKPFFRPVKIGLRRTSPPSPPLCAALNITKDRCPIPMDTTVRLGPLKFSLQATIDHHGPSIDSGHYTASINCCKKTFYCNDHKITEFGITDKNSSLHILYYINGLTHDFWTRTGGWEFDRSHGAGTSSPSHWQQVEEQAPKPVGWTMCFLLMTLVPVQKLCVNIYVYIYMCIYIPCKSSVIGRIYNGSVIQYWRSCTPSYSIGLFLGSARFLGWMPLFVFFGLPIVSCSLIKI